MKATVSIIFLVIFLFTGCYPNFTFSDKPRQLSSREVAKINQILKEALDTLDTETPQRFYAEKSHPPPITKADGSIVRSIVGNSERGFLNGVKDVKAKLEKGELECILSNGASISCIIKGTPYTEADLFKNILLTKYGISYKFGHGCVLIDSELAYEVGYYMVFNPVMKRFFGFDPMEKAHDEASKICKASYE